MPPKRSARSRGTASSQASPSGEGGSEANVEAYDVASLPMDDAAAATPKQRGPHPPQKALRKERRQSGGGAGAAAAGSTDETGASPQPTLGETEAASLAEVALQSLVDGTGTAVSVADAVLSVYRGGEKERAVCAILNVMAKASGVAEVELDGNALADGVEVRPLLEELYARVPEDSEAYLLVNKDAKYRRFRRAFPEWCAALVRDAFACDVLLDEPFLPALAQWVMAMSESKSRSFRHTATAALLAFVHALSSVAADLQGQLALLRTKKDIAALQRKRDDVAEWRDHVFSQAIHQRLRDVAPDIRAAAFQALRRWILEFPEEFMTNKYLRYLGMPLHDKRPELRAEALDTILQALARVPDAYSRLHLFLQYFTNRLVELSNDVDVRCTELAIRVVALMVRSDSDVPEGSELLNNEQVDQVLLTLFDERPTIRAAAGVLLKVFIHCRTAAEESEAAQVCVGTELLCSFAATLRSQYREAMPERYLIDALWTPERPPLLLTEFQPILAASQSDKPLDAVVGLHLIEALLLRLQGRLTLGPLPKDDRRSGTATAGKKVPPAAKAEAEALLHRLSEDAAPALCSILEVHSGSEDVLHATAGVCAALDLSTFTSQRHHTTLSALLIELRKATLRSSCTTLEGRESLAKAWHHLAFTEHPLRNEAQAHLQELLKNVVAQLTRTAAPPPARGSHGTAVADTSSTLHTWARMNLASALVPVTAHWPTIEAALSAALAAQPAAADPSLVTLVVGTAVQCLLWEVGSSSDETRPALSLSELKARVRELAAAVLQFEVESAEAALLATPANTGGGETSGAVPLAEVLVYLCDILALPYCDMAQTQQETLLRVLRGLYERISEELRGALDYLKLHVQERRALQQQQQQSSSSPFAASGASAGLAELVAARRLCSRVEALQLRLVTSVARLFLFKRLDVLLAPAFLSLWTQTPSKTVADAFKSLFHSLRDRAGDDGFTLERDVLLAAYHHCAEVGATPASVEALYQTGLKLSSLHFGGTDRWYSCCPAMVRCGADFATSTDPLLLQAIAPYAAKLRPADALHVLREQLSQRSLFAEATNPYVRGFVTALRRAAKLEDPAVALASASGLKRQRALAGAAQGQEEEEEGMLRAITQGLAAGDALAAAGAASAPLRGVGRGQRISVASRVVTADGWHVRAAEGSRGATQDDDVVEVSVSQGDGAASAAGTRAHRGVVNLPTTQETALSSLADALDSDEVFVATEEFE
ncbi:STAG domain containing protein [Novymonas esmeraldas]|uniref:STAG domain containing protein n=1 Tax=Novymonas esmeraldas TaxID=1808958 RepID=A0AAW0EZQ1_9TRYP